MNKEDIEELKREIKALKQANIEYKEIIDTAINFVKIWFDSYKGFYEYETLIALLMGQINERHREIIGGKSND